MFSTLWCACNQVGQHRQLMHGTEVKLVLVCRGENLDGKAAAQAAVKEARQAGGRISAFFCESILSCGGQVVLPAGYLQDVYQVMHEAGALCIADEVMGPFGASLSWRKRRTMTPSAVCSCLGVGTG